MKSVADAIREASDRMDRLAAENDRLRAEVARLARLARIEAAARDAWDGWRIGDDTAGPMHRLRDALRAGEPAP